ncbi:MAG: LPS assembly lipoprotein LptE [Mesorhizobium sp.]
MRRFALVGAAASVLLAAGCTVRPLYSDAPLGNSNVSAKAELASIAVKPVSSRYAQQVRNNLIFGLYGGAQAPAAPTYSLALNVSELVQSAATIQVTTDVDQPTAGTVTLTAAYTLTDAQTGKTVATGTRSISSSYDKPSQEFANYRAQIDAENRAARELGELLRLALAQDLAKKAR